MNKHGDPGFSNDWWGRDPIEFAEVEDEEPEPEAQECDGCGKDFHPDHDNTRYGRYGATTYVCDRCLTQGWPFGRDHKEY